MIFDAFQKFVNYYTMSFGSTIVLIFISVILYLMWHRKKRLLYFEKYNVPYIKPNFIFGNATDIFLRGKSRATVLQEFYCKLDPHKIAGVFNMSTPIFLIRDPEVLKNVLIKDFEYFQDHADTTFTDDDLYTENLFSLKGQKWKNLRIKLTAMFTNNKTKMMCSLVEECAKNLHDALNTHSGKRCFELKELTSRFTTDVIASCFFGIEANCLKNPDNQFDQKVRRLLEMRFKPLSVLLWANLPKKIIKLFGVTLAEKDTQEYLRNIIATTVKHREQNNIIRNDLLDVAIALKRNTTSKKYQDRGEKSDLSAQISDKLIKNDVEMTDELLTAQGIGFLLAGADTTANALAFAMFELAQNPFIQNRLREEINDVMKSNNAGSTYELLKKMTYMDMVILEILRKYPSSVALLRECKNDYQVPNTDVTIPAKSMIVVPLTGIHNDVKYYENPDKFYPEHFTEEAKAKRPRYTFLPFGDGPRTCLAERFAKMQMRIALIYMLKNFVFQVSPKMKLPLEFGNDFGLTAKNGLWVSCETI